MPDDYANRIGRRALNVGLGDRPTPDDINDLRRRQDEHAKRTRQKPQKSFHDTLADNNRQDSDNESQETPHNSEQGGTESQSNTLATPAPEGDKNGANKKSPLPTLGRRPMIRV